MDLLLLQLAHNIDDSLEYMLNLAIGWLAREDKVNITTDRKTLRIQLRSE